MLVPTIQSLVTNPEMGGGGALHVMAYTGMLRPKGALTYHFQALGISKGR